MNEDEDKMYKEMAELKLQNRLLSDRLDMMTSTAKHYMDMRADLCRQLEKYGLAIAINNQLIERPK